MEIAEKEHKKKYKKQEIKSPKKEIIPTWFNENIESTKDSGENEEFKKFIEEFRK